ncbi:MAG: hypothetical protein ACOC3G_01995 [Phycisphaeraceae bacterium]
MSEPHASNDRPPDPRNDPRAEGFFIGDRAMPRVHVWVLLALSPLLLATVLGTAALLGRAQPSAGEAFASPQRIDVQGTIRMEPYPALVRTDQAGRSTSYLLAGETKRGVADEVRTFDGSIATVTGQSLEREGKRMLLISGEDAIRGAAEAMEAEKALSTQQLGPQSLVGEIVDSRCYLGAMKPGHGKTHRPCAQLCILGGIPPVLIVPQPAGGSPEHYLVTTATGQRFTGEAVEQLLPHVGLPVRVTGEVTRRGDLLRIAVDPTRGIERVGG